MKKVTAGERLSMVIDILGVTVTDFTKTIHYASTKSIYNIINNETNLSRSFAYKVVNAYPQVNVNYLLDGTNPVLLDKPKSIGQANLLEEEPASINTVPQDLRDIKNLLQDVLDRLG